MEPYRRERGEGDELCRKQYERKCAERHVEIGTLVVLSFTVLMCFFQQIKLLSLPELLAHSLEMTASMKLYVQHGVRLHGEGNGILRLVGSTR